MKYLLPLIIAMTLAAADAEAQFFIKKPLEKHVAPGTKVSEFKTDEVITISTKLGDVVILLSDRTPKHKANFIKLAKEGFYDGTSFHRIIDGFMIQGGDINSKDSIPGNDGQGNIGYTIPAEFDTALTHVQGAVAAARLGDGVNPMKESSGSQFYIVENKAGTPFLNQNYTVFGKVLKGIEVVEAIAEQPKGFMDRPLERIDMKVKVETMNRKEISKLYGVVYQ